MPLCPCVHGHVSYLIICRVCFAFILLFMYAQSQTYYYQLLHYYVVVTRRYMNIWPLLLFLSLYTHLFSFLTVLLYYSPLSIVLYKMIMFSIENSIYVHLKINITPRSRGLNFYLKYQLKFC